MKMKMCRWKSVAFPGWRPPSPGQSRQVVRANQAPLVTSESGVLRQSSYYPYAWASNTRGRVLDVRDQAPFVDLVATHDARNSQASASWCSNGAP
jgi:hypothetical protein